MSKMVITHRENLWSGHFQFDMVDAVQECPDGQKIPIKREILQVPDSVAVLLYRQDNHHLILTSQWRAPVLASGDGKAVIEVCAGNIDPEDYGSYPQDEIAAARRAVYREVMEETGWTIKEMRFLCALYSCPGVSTEKLYYFVASVNQKKGTGGGLRSEGESIELVEMKLSVALRAVEENKIIDLKTAFLLQYLKVNENLFLTGKSETAR